MGGGLGAGVCAAGWDGTCDVTRSGRVSKSHAHRHTTHTHIQTLHYGFSLMTCAVTGRHDVATLPAAGAQWGAQCQFGYTSVCFVSIPLNRTSLHVASVCMIPPSASGACAQAFGIVLAIWIIECNGLRAACV